MIVLSIFFTARATDTAIHISPSTSRSSTPKQSDSRLTNMEPFIIRTSIANKKKFDLQIAKFIYATNSAFRHVEHPEFIKLINLLHPGYKPPLRRQIANELLDEVFNSETVKIRDYLNGKNVCMAQDGWSNIRNDSIVCISATDIIDETVHLCDTIDTKDIYNSHTAEYLLSLAVTSIKNCQKYMVIGLEVL